MFLQFFLCLCINNIFIYVFIFYKLMYVCCFYVVDKKCWCLISSVCKSDSNSLQVIIINEVNIENWLSVCFYGKTNKKFKIHYNLILQQCISTKSRYLFYKHPKRGRFISNLRWSYNMLLFWKKKKPSDITDFMVLVSINLSNQSDLNGVTSVHNYDFLTHNLTFVLQ